MDVGTLEALLIFALAAAPGAIVSEIVTFGRPPLRERNRVRSLAFYLVMSAGAWAVAAIVFASGDDLIILIDARAGEATKYVAATGRLFAELLIAALIAGGMLRIATGLALRAAQWLYEKRDLQSAGGYDRCGALPAISCRWRSPGTHSSLGCGTLSVPSSST